MGSDMVRENSDWTVLARGTEHYLCCLPFLELPWLRHAFSFGADGAGVPQNLGLHVGGDADDVRERRRRFLAGLGFEIGSLVAAQQVHGDRVAVVGENERGAGACDYKTALPATDGLATDLPGLVLSVYYADCAPVLLVDPVRRAVAAVHAGWRGAVAGIAARAVAVMTAELGCDPGRMLAAVGPAIGACCYRVGDDVAAVVPAGARAKVIIPRQDGLHLDLAGLNAWWLRSGGLSPARIHLSRHCTACELGRFFSFRRQGQAAGRMMAIIAIRDDWGGLPLPAVESPLINAHG
ncbi:MAG: peptidoglycan editing factor PgeF [Bacteroidota bacterium]